MSTIRSEMAVGATPLKELVKSGNGGNVQVCCGDNWNSPGMTLSVDEARKSTGERIAEV
jgi:hypothetical protein